MSKAIWMTFSKLVPSTDENGQMSHEHMLTRALVMFALAESIGMPHLLTQTTKLFKEEVATATREQV
jgi:hypothetical protein